MESEVEEITMRENPQKYVSSSPIDAQKSRQSSFNKDTELSNFDGFSPNNADHVISWDRASIDDLNEIILPETSNLERVPSAQNSNKNVSISPKPPETPRRTPVILVDDKPVKTPTNEHNNNVEENIISAEEAGSKKTTACGQFQKGVCSNASKVIITRLLYTIHVLFTIWRVTEVLGATFWFMAAWILTFVVDVCVILVKRKGKEWSWFQPIVLLYLLVEMTGIWFLELEKVSGVQEQYNKSAILGDLYGKGHEATHISVNSVTVKINSDSWALLLEQSMLVLIIGARWLMPKGEMTKEQLSGLLLSYLGTASDVVDFFSVLSEDPKLSLDLIFVFTILSTWTWSMIQFMFVVTMTKPDDVIDNKVSPEDGIRSNSSVSVAGETRVLVPSTKKPKSISCCRAFVESEIWSIFVSVVLQDGPFVIVRLTCVFYWNIRTYTNYFFTFKNCMMLMLQVYRIIAVYQKYSDTSVHKKGELNKNV